MAEMASKQFKTVTTTDDKHDVKVNIDYCIMQNWFDPSKETEAANWTKPGKAMVCLRASLFLQPEQSTKIIQLRII